jgi:hypothetical protein
MSGQLTIRSNFGHGRLQSCEPQRQNAIVTLTCQIARYEDGRQTAVWLVSGYACQVPPYQTFNSHSRIQILNSSPSPDEHYNMHAMLNSLTTKGRR